MAITTGTLAVKDGGGTSRNFKTLNDSADTSLNPGHPLINSTGGFVTFPEGHGTAATALRVELPTDGTGVVGLNAGASLIGKVGIDQTTLGTTNRAYVNTAPKVTAATGTMTRVADTNAYAFGDFIANNVTAASCTLANSGFTIAAARGNDVPGRLLKCKLDISGTVVTNAIFRVHYYSSNPLASAPANGDNGAFVPANKANYLGRMDVTVNFVSGDGASGFGFSTEGSCVEFTPDAGTSNIYALLEARGAFTPTSGEVFTLTTITE